MKFILMMHAPANAPADAGNCVLEARRSPEDDPVHELTERGSQSQGRAGKRGRARLSLRGRASSARKASAAPLVTDGPFAETKEFLVGYWIVEVAELEQRAIESRPAPPPVLALAASPSTRAAIRSRQVMPGPPA